MGQNWKLSSFIRTVAYLKPQQLWARADYRLRCFYYRSPFYPIMEEEITVPENLLLTPAHLWEGHKEAGQKISENTFTFVGRTVAMGQQMNWLPQEVSTLWIYNLHYFNWLADLNAAGRQGKEDARHLIEDWIRHCNHFDTVIWHPYPLSLRIVNWMIHAQWLLKGSSDTFRTQFMESLMRQAEHLIKVLEWDVGGNHLIKNIKATIYISLCLPNKQSLYLESIKLLLQQLKIQILPDGSHYERSPHYHAEVLQDLLDIQALILKSGQRTPPQLEEAIDRMGTVLKFYRHGDKQLALFNDGDIGQKKLLDKILKRCDTDDDTPNMLPDAGYARLKRGKTLLLIDSGPCCPDTLPAHAHADTLSFEMSIAGERIFVNSGTYAYQHKLRNTLRGTAAHNTIAIDGKDSAEVWHNFRLGRRPTHTTILVREEPKIGIGFEGSHNGYRHLGVQHLRTIFLSDDGQDVRGEDILQSKKPHQARAHFHLHPDVSYTLKTENEVELTTKKGMKLSFRIHGGRLYDASSIYAPHFGEKHSSKKLILRADWRKKECTLRWAIKVI